MEPRLRRKPGTRGMPRPDRERLILDIAGALFAERGYHAVTMDDVAARADISKPVVYAYFGSKEGLYRAYIKRSGEELLERLRRAADPNAGAQERLHAGIIEFLNFVDERRDGWAVLYAEAGARGGPLADELAELRSRIARIVSGLVERGGQPPNGSSRHMTELDGIGHAFVGAGESLANWWLRHPELPLGQVARWLDAFAQAAVEGATCRQTSLDD